MDTNQLSTTPLYQYLDCRLCWSQDPETGQWYRLIFGPDAKTLGTSFKRDPAFPRSWICEVANSPAVNVISEIVELVLTDPVPDEIHILHEALALACAVEQDNLGAAVLAGFGLAAAVVGAVEWSRNRRAAAA